MQTNLTKIHIYDHFRIASPGDSLEKMLPFDPGRPSAWNGVLFLVCLEGETSLRINQREYRLTPGTLASVLPYQVVEVPQAPDASFRIAAVTFTIDFMLDFPFALKAYISENMEKLPCIGISAEQQQQLLKFHRLIAEQYARTDHPSRTETIKSLLFTFIAEIGYIYSQRAVVTTPSRQEGITDTFFKLLHQHHAQERYASFYAEKMCLTPKYLAHIVKLVTGKTPHFWISEFTVKKAMVLLKSSDLTVSQISDELKFPNPSFFSRFFRKHTGMTPLQFRKSVVTLPQ